MFPSIAPKNPDVKLDFGFISVFSTDAKQQNYSVGKGHFSCSQDGFDITISRNATAPPLNLDDVWIPSGEGRCKPQNKSKDAVTFRFPFTDCGTQSVVNVHQLLLAHIICN